MYGACVAAEGVYVGEGEDGLLLACPISQRSPIAAAIPTTHLPGEELEVGGLLDVGVGWAFSCGGGVVAAVVGRASLGG